MASLGVCVLCGEPINERAADVYAQEIGFAQRRSEGGVHALALRRETGEHAHQVCVEKLRA